MCTFVTLPEKRGIVYSEHMLVTAAVMDAAVNTVTWISLDQSMLLILLCCVPFGNL